MQVRPPAAVPCHSELTRTIRPQAQFYAHGLGLTPAERRFRLVAALVMEAAVLLLLGAELRK